VRLLPALLPDVVPLAQSDAGGAATVFTANMTELLLFTTNLAGVEAAICGRETSSFNISNAAKDWPADLSQFVTTTRTSNFTFVWE
jgi:hypothetical protein